MRHSVRTKRRPVRHALALIAALALASCAASAPTPPGGHPPGRMPAAPPPPPPPAPRPAFLDNPALHPAYGGERYLKAVGLSAAGRAEAEMAAKKGVAEQVRSSLRAVTTDRMEEIRRGGSETVVAEYRSLITTETAFDRAELIRIDAAASWKDGSAFYAFAYLDRAALAEALEPEYARDAAAFSALARNAERALEGGDPMGFIEGYRAAAEAFAGLEEKARVLSVAAGGPYAPHREEQGLFISLIDRQLALKSGLRFVVSLRGPESQLGRERLKAMFQGFFRQAGYRAVICESCQCGGPLEYPFRVEAREVFREGVLGPVCALSLTAKVVLCGSEQTLLQMDLTSPRMKGAHTSDRQVALRKLYDGLPREEIYRAFEAGMRARFPAAGAGAGAAARAGSE